MYKQYSKFNDSLLKKEKKKKDKKKKTYVSTIAQLLLGVTKQ